jgi:EAL domain-containing protein (putative c-di-GMP-specific phosphodiesterase class I)
MLRAAWARPLFVENAETLEMLKRMGIDMVQGYHLDKPQENHPAIAKCLAVR